MDGGDLLWALAGLALGLIIWAFYARRAAARSENLEAERDRLERKLRQARATIERRDAEIATLGGLEPSTAEGPTGLDADASVTTDAVADTLIDVDADREIATGLAVSADADPDPALDPDVPIDDIPVPSARRVDTPPTLATMGAEGGSSSDVPAAEGVATAGLAASSFIAGSADAGGRRDDLAPDVAELDDVAGQAVARAQQLNDRLSAANSRIEAGDARIATLEAAIVRADERIRDRNATITRLESELTELRAEDRPDPEAIRSLEQQLAECRTARAEAAESITQLTAERDQLTETLDATEHQLRVTTEELAERELSSAETRRQLASIRRRLASIVDQDTIDLRDPVRQS